MKPGFCVTVVLASITNIVCTLVYCFSHGSLLWLSASLMTDLVLIIVGTACLKTQKIIRYEYVLDEIAKRVNANWPTCSQISQTLINHITEIGLMDNQAEIDYALGQIVAQAELLGLIGYEDHSAETIDHFVKMARDY